MRGCRIPAVSEASSKVSPVCGVIQVRGTSWAEKQYADQLQESEEEEPNSMEHNLRRKCDATKVIHRANDGGSCDMAQFYAQVIYGLNCSPGSRFTFVTACQHHSEPHAASYTILVAHIKTISFKHQVSWDVRMKCATGCAYQNSGLH